MDTIKQYMSHESDINLRTGNCDSAANFNLYLEQPNKLQK